MLGPGAAGGELGASHPYRAAAANPPAFPLFALEIGGKKAESNTFRSQRNQAFTQLPRLTDWK